MNSTNSTKKNSRNIFSLVLTVALISLMTAAIIPGVMGATALNLGTAGNYAILTETGITGGAGSTITGDIGVSPIGYAAITGFSLIPQVPDAFTVYSTSTSVSGKVYAANYIAPTPSNLGIAVGVNGMEGAYNSGWTQATTVTNAGAAGNIGSLTLAPGVYDFNTALHINSDVTLDAQGDQNAVWIFRTSGTFDTAAGTHVILKNGAQSDNVFWVVADATSLGSNSVLYGTILDKTKIAFGSAATLNGRALAQTEVTLLSSTVDKTNVQAPVVTVPTVTMIAPSTGPLAGGTTVVITGTGFTGVTAVKFGVTPATSYTVNSATQITAIAPVGTGTVDVTVTTAGGTSATSLADQYTYAPVPTFVSILPVSGPTTGNTAVTITGTNLIGATSVTFGGTSATGITVVSGTKITATTPAGTGTANVVVITPNGTTTEGAGAYTYVTPPAAPTALSAQTNAAGTVITITFNKAMTDPLGKQAEFKYKIVGGTDQTFSAADLNSDLTKIDLITSGTAIAFGNTVTVSYTKGTVTAADTGVLATFAGQAVTNNMPAPTVTSIAPASGAIAGGNIVTITGTSFTGVTGPTAVTFGGTAATSYTVDSATQITATTPAHAAGPAVDVVVTTNGGAATKMGAYTYINAPIPTFISIAPASGLPAGGTSTVITGTDFTGVTAVTFGGTAATSYTVNSATQITATTPAHAAGIVNVVVTTNGGAATGTGAYTYGTPGSTTVNLGSAGNFVILAKSAITTTGSTSVVGDIGISPAAASYMTGFGLTRDASNQFSTSSLVTGKIYAANYAVPTPSTMITAISDMETAYNDAAGRTSPTQTNPGASGDLAGLTLAPGLYKFTTYSNVIITNDVTLSGGADAVWIFQIPGTLDISSGKHVILSGGAQAKNVYWQVAGATTLGTNSVFNGIILDKTNIALLNGATLNGRALAQTAVTIDGDSINAPTTAAAVPISGGSDISNEGSGYSGGGESSDSSGQLAPIVPYGVTPVNRVGPLTSTPLAADLSGMPGVAVSWTTQINDDPAPNARITTVIQIADSSTRDAFTTALHRVGLDLSSLLYVMNVQKTGINSTGPATVSMTASRDWITQNGGKEAITIIGMADDGTTQVLSTWYDGNDLNSNYPIFTAALPHGLDFTTFGLVAVKPYTPATVQVTPASVQVTPVQLAPTQAPAASTTTPIASTGGGLLPTMGIAGVAAIAIIGVALVLFTPKKK
jgi:hypothetical protein